MSKTRKKWPKTVDEAVDQILPLLTEKDRETIKNTSEDGMILFHHGTGARIRHEFCLGVNKELHNSCDSEDPDDCSMIILKAVWRRIHRK